MLFLNKTVLAFITSCYLLTTAAAGDLSANQDPLNPEQVVENSLNFDKTYNSKIRYYQVKNNDTIWSIASQYIPDDKSINEYQIISSIYRNNPKAFGGGNLNNLHKVNLKIPTDAVMSLEKERSGMELIKKGKIKLPALPQNNISHVNSTSIPNFDENKLKSESKIVSSNFQAIKIPKDPLEDINPQSLKKEDNGDLNSVNNLVDSDEIKNNEIKTEIVKQALSQEVVENKNEVTLDTLNQVIAPLSSKLDTKLTDLKNEIKSLNDSYNANEKKSEVAQKQISELEHKYTGSVTSLKQDLTYVKDKISKLEGENSSLKEQAQYYKDQLSKLETKFQEKEQQSLDYNNLLQNILSIGSILLALLCLLVLLKVIKNNNRKEKVKVITYTQPIIEEKAQEPLVKDHEQQDVYDKKQENAKDESNFANSESLSEQTSDIDAKNKTDNNKLDKNNLNDNLDINNQDNPENYKSDSITANVKKKTKSLRKRERPYIKSNRDESDVKDDLAKSNPKISSIVTSQEKQVKFDKEQDIAIDRSDLVKNLYQNDDDYENIVDEEYDPSYQKYKDKFDLAQVFIDTGDIDEALEMLLEIKEQADPYLANKAERLIEQYADH